MVYQKLVLLFVWFGLMMTTQQALAKSYKTMELKPIQVQGWKYFYDFKRVNSPYALVIPMQSLEDEEINRRLNSYNTLQTLRGLGYLASVLYLISGASSSQSADETFLILFGAAIVADLSFTIIAHHQMRLAIDKYNLSIISPQARTKAVYPQSSLGLRFLYKF